MDNKPVGAVIEFTGIVQGVGFRPAIYRTAVRYNLRGEVRNTERGVQLKLDGEKKKIVNFLSDFLNHLPPLAEIHETRIKYQKPFGFKHFEIEKSIEGENRFTPISPDVATCAECLKELFTPSDRRYRYPFINCTNCGPRFTIIESVPYDRKNTTMKVFEMCAECSREYNDPLDRRYHAQPNACPVCGPRLFIFPDESVPAENNCVSGKTSPALQNPSAKSTNQSDNNSQKDDKKNADAGFNADPIKIAAEKIREGKIVAIKGLGGYHLAVDPFNEEAVLELRKRKKRPGKPFALMARDLEIVKKYCMVSKEAERLLLSYQRPIVLLKRKDSGVDYYSSGDLSNIRRKEGVLNAATRPTKIDVEGDELSCCAGRWIAREVAPDTDYLGVMLPYTPIHHLLMDEGFELLVMTSANISEEPLAYIDADAKVRLRGIADFYLSHNREIARPCDDSVVCVLEEDGIRESFPLRRSRGYVPRAIIIERESLVEGKKQILAFGPQEKNTFCVIKGGKAFLSHHIGDLDNPKSVEAYERGIRDFIGIFNVDVKMLICDMHPDYTSTRIAEKFARLEGLPLIRVQHHHAHLASLLAERGEEHIGSDTKIIGVIFDGTGYGLDGAIWGGEFLYGNAESFERVGHIQYVVMFGGEKCIKELSRMALGWLLTVYRNQENIPRLPLVDETPPERMNAFKLMYENKIPAPLTSSCGRLFDAVSAILGLCYKPAYDAQGAILLETCAERYFDEHLKKASRESKKYWGKHYRYDIKGDGFPFVLDFSPTIREIVDDTLSRESSGYISYHFHKTVAHASTRMCERIREKTGCNTVGLSGGVFQNKLLLKMMLEELDGAGFDVLTHRLVPPNDGGISLGQAYIGYSRFKKLGSS